MFVCQTSIVEGRQHVQLTIPPGSLAGITCASPISVMQFGRHSGMVPRAGGAFLVHVRAQVASGATLDTRAVLAAIVPGVEVTFEHTATRRVRGTRPAGASPEWLHLTSGRDAFAVDFEAEIAEAKAIFERIAPGEPFLPATLSPEEAAAVAELERRKNAESPDRNTAGAQEEGQQVDDPSPHRGAE